ncbi:MAG: 3'(2'),5'-bisphosphate nucleotidase CysQ [Bacteroidales bacterium]|nr:3'(2'),5'-bisphosphate nucleotidase CysQ [Bacteroidales bacterium]
MRDLYNVAIRAAVMAGKAILEVYNSNDLQVIEKEDKSPLTKADRAAHQVIVSHLDKTGIPVLSEEGRDIPFEERSGWDRFWLVDPLDGTKEFIKRNGEFTVNIALVSKGRPVFGVVYAPVLGNLYVGIPGEGSWLTEVPRDNEMLENVKNDGTSLPVSRSKFKSPYKVVASRSHLNPETEHYLEQIKAAEGEIEIVTKGSSLKLCMVATGEADIYPRLGPTMEWDVAAAHAVVSGAGKHVYRLKEGESEKGKWEKDGELRYNKKNLLNPYFLVT